tara:strand:+ start:118836 stop:119012 length:177 start_codon:yes stop_codon:yes gene_type:complete
MSNETKSVVVTTAPPTLMHRVGEFLQDPLGSVVAASAAAIGAFGFVISGTWFIQMALN